MKALFGDDTDEENCDDPIKLFDSDFNAVYFGSQPNGQSTIGKQSIGYDWQFEDIKNDEFCRLEDNSRSAGEIVLQTLQCGSTSECDISSPCVKLVDCYKFPWYFRKHTQQILHKINVTQPSDSDELDMVGIEDSDLNDCFIVEDSQDVVINEISNFQLKENTVKVTPKSITSKMNTNKHINDIKRHKENVEIKRALSLKNVVKVDFKRNQGLIGMKIIKKTVKNSTLNVATNQINEAKAAKTKQKHITPDETYINAADKILSHIGTQLIPIPEEKGSNFICQPKIHEERLIIQKSTPIKTTTSNNVPVQLNINYVCDKPIDNKKINKINDVLSEGNNKSVELLSKSLLKCPENKLNLVNEKYGKVTMPEISANHTAKVTTNVKDMKKTNKYKNDQIKKQNKASHSSLLGLLVTRDTKGNIIELIQSKQKKNKHDTQSKVAELVKNPKTQPTNKRIEKHKREVKSPILPCSTVLKKPKTTHEMLPKCSKSDTYSNQSKELDNFNKIDKLTNLQQKCSNKFQNESQSIHVDSKSVTDLKLSAVSTKQPSQEKSCMMQDKITSQLSETHTKSLKVSDNHVNNLNDVNKNSLKANNLQSTEFTPSSNNKNLSYDAHDDVNKRTKNAVLVKNPLPIGQGCFTESKASNQNNKPTACKNNAPKSAVVTPTNDSKSKVIADKYTEFINSLERPFASHKAVSSKMSCGNFSNDNNIPVNNRYASAIILKPNPQINLPVGNNKHECPVQAIAPSIRHNLPIPVHTQQRFHDFQHIYPQYYQSTPSGRYQSSLPCPVKSMSNQLNPPEENIYQANNSMQSLYQGCWQPQNVAVPPLPPPPPPPPPPLPVPPPPVPPPTPNIAPRNDNKLDQTRYNDYVNHPVHPSMAVTHPQMVPGQTFINSLQTKDSSIIGMNNDGLVKKINIVAVPVAKIIDAKNEIAQIEVKDPQIIYPIGESEVVGTKTEMLEELDKLSFADEDTNDVQIIYRDSRFTDTKKEESLSVSIMTRNPGKFETLKLTMNHKNIRPLAEQSKGYSPPILPIPTYQKVLDCEVSHLQTPKIPNILRAHDPRTNFSSKTKPLAKRDFFKDNKRKLSDANYKSHSRRKDDAKKISLEEYKKRLFESDSKSEYSKYNNSRKRSMIDYKNKKNLDYSTETDLGYDSDSTVVL